MFSLKASIIRIVGIITLIPIIFIFSGCAGTMHAIQHRDMSLSAQMSDTIFLDPEILNKNRSVFVRVTNTSDFQEINFADILKGKLTVKGFSITNSPSSAGYIIQANLLYIGTEKQDLTAEGMLAGGFGGAMGGSRIGSGWTSAIAGAAGMGIVGSVVGGVVGSMIHVDTYLGAVDIQVKEASKGMVKGVMKTDARQGSSTTLQTEKEVKSNFQEYRTRIVVKATQTNINRVKACNAIADRLAMQIAGIF